MIGLNEQQENSCKGDINLEEDEMICDKCDGKGYEKHHLGNIICPKCQGDGKVDWISNITGKPSRFTSGTSGYSTGPSMSSSYSYVGSGWGTSGVGRTLGTSGTNGTPEKLTSGANGCITTSRMPPFPSQVGDMHYSTKDHKLRVSDGDTWNEVPHKPKKKAPLIFRISKFFDKNFK